MTKEDITQIKELLNSPKNIVITTHRNPDGDAMGSCLGLYHFLILKKHNVNVITPTEYPEFLHWLPGNDEVIDYSAEKAKAAELIFEFICMLNEQHSINKSIAICLYTGIMTDTGSFSYASTTAKSHKIAALLIEAGADNGKIHESVFHNNSENRVRFLGYCLSNKLKVLPGYKTAY